MMFNFKEVIELNDLIEMVTEKNGVPVTNSRIIAEKFNKEHSSVLKNIEGETRNGKHVDGLIDDILASGNPPAKYFMPTAYLNRGKKYKEYLLTREGFSLLAMGFTGKEALQWKIKYIEAFNQMESFIKSLQQAKLEFPAFTNAIMDAHTEPKHYHFSNEIDMINRIVLGMSASKFKESNGIDKKTPSIRPYLTLEQMQKIEELQRVDIGLFVAGLEFEIRKQILTNHLNKKYLLAS